MAFWNRRDSDKKKPTVIDTSPIARAITNLRSDVENLRHEVDRLHIEVSHLRENQSVPIKGGVPAGGTVQDWLPVVDRFQELLLVQMGNPDLAQAFGTYARQRELRDADKPEPATDESDESTYEAF